MDKSLEKLKLKEMRKIVSVFFVMWLFISCTKRVYYSSDWQSKNVTVDGKITEWSDPLRFYDGKTRINYTISNDYQNLYLCCCISDELLQTKILRSGLEFGIDTLGKKSFPVSIKFPVNNKLITESIRNTNPQKEAGSKERLDNSFPKLKLITEAREIQLVGFKPPLGRIISLSGPNISGISAAINFDGMGNMFYEAVIPFSTFYKKELIPSDSNTLFNYRIKVGPVPKSNINQGRGGGMRNGGMRGGGMEGGGMRGGGMQSGGMQSGRMGSGMSASDIYRDFGENGFQRTTSMSGITKTTIKLKLSYR